MRIALCSPIFLAISFGWLYKDGAQPITFLWMKYCFPLALIWTFTYKPSWSTNWGHHVITTYFVDVISFGSITLLFAILSFASLSFFWSRMSWLSRMISLLAFLIGLYLSIKSGSRTGWLSFPVFLYILFWGYILPTQGRLKSFLIILFVLVLILIFIQFSPFFAQKVLNAVTDVTNYNWNSQSVEGSADLIISFFRMAIFYFLQNPIKGWGDLGWQALVDSPEIIQFASKHARHFAQHGFHNEVLTNAVRSGIWGLVTSISFFVFPTIVAIKSFHKPACRFSAFFIIFFMLHIFLTGMTTEITNLVFLASFYSLTIAVMVGELLSTLSRKTL